MKKFSKLLLSLVVYGVNTGSIHEPISNGSLVQSSQSKRTESIRESLSSSKKAQKAPALSKNATIINWCKKANTCEELNILYNLCGNNLFFLSEDSIKQIKKIIAKKCAELRVICQEKDLKHSKVNISEYVSAINNMLYQTKDGGIVDYDSRIKDRSLIDSLNKIVENKEQIEYIRPEISQKCLGFKFYVMEQTVGKKIRTVKLLLDENNFEIVYKTDGSCHLVFTNQINEISDISKIKLEIKIDVLKSLLNTEVKASELENIGGEKDNPVTKPKDFSFTKGVFSKFDEFLNKDKKNIYELIDKSDLLLIRTVIGNVFQKNETTRNLQSYCAAFDQKFIGFGKTLINDDTYFSFNSTTNAMKKFAYLKPGNTAQSIGFEYADKYVKNIMSMNETETKLYSDQSKILEDGRKSQKYKKDECDRLSREANYVLSGLQKQNAKLLTNPTVNFLFNNKSHLFITQEAKESISTSIRNMEKCREAYNKLQVNNPTYTAPLPKGQKTSKTSCCC